jgi:hypothetical protein
LRDKNLRRIFLNKTTLVKVIVYYESIKREPKIRGIYECRCDERLQTKTKEFTRLPYTGLVLELENKEKDEVNKWFFYLKILVRFFFCLHTGVEQGKQRLGLAKVVIRVVLAKAGNGHGAQILVEGRCRLDFSKNERNMCCPCSLF